MRTQIEPVEHRPSGEHRQDPVLVAKSVLLAAHREFDAYVAKLDQKAVGLETVAFYHTDYFRQHNKVFHDAIMKGALMQAENWCELRQIMRALKAAKYRLPQRRGDN